ncbi:MAG: hypothetical protein AAFO03_09605 [Bacteroidota bacterium]
MQNILLLSLLFFSTSIFCQANRLVGYWQVKQVTVEQETMTPVSKWFHFDASGNMQGGNGGNMNLFGSWTSENESSLIFSNQQGKPDRDGPFSVSWEGELLILERDEEFQPVKVTLEAFDPTNWPRAPWDQISGSWILVSDTPVPNAEALQFAEAFFRWDNSVSFNFGHETLDSWTALWRIHAHRPQLELAPRATDAAIMTWNIEFSKEQMIWTRNFEGNPQRLVWTKKP